MIIISFDRLRGRKQEKRGIDFLVFVAFVSVCMYVLPCFISNEKQNIKKRYFSAKLL